MSNPLSKYFRQPVIYMELPSGGRWWRPGSLQLTPDRKLPITAMTARDEILLKTPDALLNGISLVEIFQSCCSAIKDAWAIPNVDVDALLIGVRIASYGNILDVNSTCPHCNAQNKHGIDLTERLASIRCPDFNKTYAHEELVFKFKPLTYFSKNRDNLNAFQEEKLTQSVTTSNLTEDEKIAQLADQTKRLLDASIKTLVDQTEFIQLEDGVKVVEPEFLREFYNNVDGEVFRNIQNHILSIYKEVDLPLFRFECEDCRKEYQTTMEFDYANFFGQGF